MKAVLIINCLLFSLYANANSIDNLSKGIELFEIGQFQKAIKILEPLANSDNGYANYYLGLIYDPVFNKPPFTGMREFIKYQKSNEKKTIRLYKKAAKLGIVYANFRLGAYYQSMVFRRQKYRYGRRIWLKAEKDLKPYGAKGDWLAKYMLARIYQDKSRIMKFGREAIEALEKQAKKGDRQAQLYLGKALSKWSCQTTKCNPFIKAFAWFAVSASNESYHAKIHLRNLAKLLDEDDLLEAKELASRYLLLYNKPHRF